MLYTSGTTGRPKGVYRPNAVPPIPAGAYALRGYGADSVQLCVGPAYHAAPLLFDVTASANSGVPLVMLDKWDSEADAQDDQRAARHAPAHGADHVPAAAGAARRGQGALAGRSASAG